MMRKMRVRIERRGAVGWMRRKKVESEDRKKRQWWMD